MKCKVSCMLFQLPTSDDYPKLVCPTCEQNLSQFANFAQLIEKNAENWEMFLARGQMNGRTDVVVDAFKDEDYKSPIATEAIKIEFCEEKYDSVPDTDTLTYDALDLVSFKIEEIDPVFTNDAPATAKPKRKRTKTTIRSCSNISTEFERTCKHCDEPTFSSLSKMYSHQKLMHPGIKIFSCDNCGATFCFV